MSGSPLSVVEQAGEPADQPPGLAAGQLGHVRVLLLRHDRRAGGVAVVDLDPAELLRGPEHDLLAQPRQVHADERRREAELGGEVPVADRVHRVGRRGAEAELRGQFARVERQRRPGQRARAERGDRRPLVPVPQPVRVPRERVHVGQQLVREQHRLGVLQVRHPGGGHACVPFGLAEQGGLQLGQPGNDHAHVVPQVQPQVRGHLVVAAPPGAQLAAEGAEPLQQPAFQGRVHVLVGGGGAERAVAAGAVEVVQGAQHRVPFGLGQQPGAVQRPGVRAGGQQIVGGQPPVELHADRQPGQRIGRPGLEPAAPQPGRRAPCFCHFCLSSSPDTAYNRVPRRHPDGARTAPEAPEAPVSPPGGPGSPRSCWAGPTAPRSPWTAPGRTCRRCRRWPVRNRRAKRGCAGR